MLGLGQLEVATSDWFLNAALEGKTLLFTERVISLKGTSKIGKYWG